jgi:hypothetical protein
VDTAEHDRIYSIYSFMLYIEMTDSSFCQQRFLTQLYNIPPTRITPDNPYSSGLYTKHQLDMRRKVEILKYSSNKSSTQTNSLTKKEKFALLVKGGSSMANAVIPSNAVSCDTDDAIPTPTSSCDVPGPVTYLTYDSTVPLYNYSGFNTRSYSEFSRDFSNPWQFIVLSDIVIYENNRNTIYYLIINNTISKSAFTYTINTPVVISIAGTIPAYSSINPAFAGVANVSLTSAALEIYYNSGNLVNTISLNNIADFDVNLNIPQNLTSTARPFNAKRFVGNLVFRNVKLYTTPSYVYTFTLNVDLKVTPNTTGLFNYIAVVTNVSSALSVSNGCTILNPPVSAVQGASISGV